MPACPLAGGSPNSAERSSQTGEYETRGMLGHHEVLGLQVSSISWATHHIMAAHHASSKLHTIPTSWQLSDRSVAPSGRLLRRHLLSLRCLPRLPQVGIHMAPGRSACRSLQRSMAEPQRHERYMAAALEAGHARREAAEHPALPAQGMGRAASAAGAMGPAPASRPATAVSSGASSLSAAASLDAELEESEEEDRLLAEAATFGAADGSDW